MAACSGVGAELETTTTEREHKGALCLATDANGDVEVRVWAGFCLSSSCDTVRETECVITREGARLVVDSHSVVETRGGSCTADCGMVAAECQLTGVAPGSYEVIRGENTANVTLPTAGVTLFDEDILNLCGHEP